MSDLVLASTSKYRRALLERIGIPFRWRAPLVVEEQLKSPELSALELAEYLAFAKASSLTEHEPRATLIGSDQLVAIGDRVLGKPASFEGAVEQLLLLSGNAHSLITALAVIHEGQVIRHTDVTTLRMRGLSRVEAERYVASDQPLDCAGSYKIEEKGITLFEEIESRDHTAIVGLPLIALTTILRRLGYRVP